MKYSNINMQVTLNKPPSIAYAKEPYLSLMEEGYAFPIEIQDNATVLLFKDVDDHTDGNGLAILWMLEGEGTFFYEGESIAFKKGDAVVFDDRIEHGFEANNYCLAVNFDIGLMQNCSLAYIQETISAFEQQRLARTEFYVPSPNF